MKTRKLFSILTLAVIIAALAFTACDTGGGAENNNTNTNTVDTSVSYKSTDSEGNTYELVITKAASKSLYTTQEEDSNVRKSLSSTSSVLAAYTAVTGDTYVLTITLAAGGTKKSSGTITVSGSVYTLSGGTSLTVTITNGKMTAMSGTIKYDNESGTKTAPSTLTPEGDSGSGAITGGKAGTTITMPVTGVPAGVTDFNYLYAYDNGQGYYVTINSVIPNSSVTVSGGNVTLKLGVPKLSSITNNTSGDVIVNPSDAKGYGSNAFFADDVGSYKLFINAGANAEMTVGLTYVDKDVTITGQYKYPHNGSDYTENYNYTLKAGWNYIFAQKSGTNGTTSTYTSSTSLPAGYSWQVVAN